jgi:hypothetical protein
MHLERSLPGVVIRLVKQQTNEFQSGTSDEQGRFSFLLLSPGLYQVEAHHPPSGILQARAAIAVDVSSDCLPRLNSRLFKSQRKKS